jgi:hypothetical protein
MATLPRYELMGVQYADLPRVSTAGLAVAAEGYSRMSQQVDRMLNFLQGERETEAQRKAKQYAIENPLTKDQIDAAVSGEGPSLQVPGAGTVFQRTYEAMQGAMLSAELQADGQRKIGEALAVVKAGGTIDVEKARTDLRDLIDGYATSVSALDPEESVRLRASLSIAGKALFAEAAAQQVKREITLINTGMDAAANSIKPVIEGIISQAGTIDPQTGSPVDVEKMLQSQLRPFQNLVSQTGHAKPLETAFAAIRTAKVDAIVGLATKDEFAANPLKALRRLADGDLGNLSEIYRGLSQDDKEVIRKRVRDYNVDQAAAQKAEDDRRKDDAARAANAMGLELLDPKTTADRRMVVVNDLVRGGYMSLESARTALKPAAAAGVSVGTELMVSQMIRSGYLSSLDQFLKEAYSNGLSDEQTKRLGKELLDENYRRAKNLLTSSAGLVGFELNPSEAKIKKMTALEELYRINLGKNISPEEAAREAIRQYDGAESTKKRENIKLRVAENVRTILEDGGFAMPNVDIERMDLGALRDRRNRPISDSMRKKLQTELDTLRAAP